MTTEQIKELQRELGVVADGLIGPKTRAAAEKRLVETSSIAAASFNAEKFQGILNTTGIVGGTDIVGDPIEEPVQPVQQEVIEEGGEVVVATELISETEKKVRELLESFTTLRARENLYSPPSANIAPAFEDANEEYVPTFDEAMNLYPYYPKNLIQKILDVWTDTGEISIALSEARASDDFEKSFPGIKRPDGSLRMTEIEYLETKDYMQDALRTYNLNPGVFEQEVATAISGDVSAREFEGRLQFAYNQLFDNIPQVKEIYMQQNGIDLSDEAIFAMFLSPELSESVLQNQILVSQISAEAEVAGLDIGITTAQQFVQSGLDQQRTRQIFGDVAAATPGIQFSAAAQGVNITDEEIATGLAGLSPEELSVIRGISTRAESESAVATGATQTQTGEVTGLLES